MKFIKYLHKNIERYGVLENEIITEIEGNVFENYKLTKIKNNISEVKILAPVSPTKIIALGYNYKDLVGERLNYDEPIIFFKPNSSIIGPGETIIITEMRKTWIEVELAIIIKKKCKNVSIENAHNFIFGYTIANDVSMENILFRDHHLARSKGWDTFCPIGPHIETVLNTSELSLSSKINGHTMQKSNVNKRILNDPQIVSFLSKKMTLFPGDLILTGTPANAEDSVINDGDIVELNIENIGVLSNNVIFKGD